MTKFVYDFSEGNRDLKDLMGGKGANLAEMTNLGLPVPPGFTITTEACVAYMREGGLPDGLDDQVDEALAANGLSPSDIDWLVPHQANTRIIDAVGRKLALPAGRTILTIDRHANTSAASIPLALDEAVADCAWVVGTSSRKVRGKRRLAPAELARGRADDEVDVALAITRLDVL